MSRVPKQRPDGPSGGWREGNGFPRPVLTETPGMAPPTADPATVTTTATGSATVSAPAPAPATATAAVAAAVAAARAAQPGWGARSVAGRLVPVKALRRRLARDGRELADLAVRPAAAPDADLPAAGAESHPTATTDATAATTAAAAATEAALSEAAALRRAEVLSAEVVPLADACRFLVREAPRLLATRRPGASGRPAWLAGVDSEVRREPHGVVLVVAPANYPVLLPGIHALQALVAGNAVLLKPGEGGTPAARWLARALAGLGLPLGVLAVLPEEPEAALAAIAAGVDQVVLTGSAETGRRVLSELAPRLVPATLELSGCDPLLALPGADPERVAAALAFGLRLNGGATCIAPRRAYLPAAMLPAVEERLVARLTDLAAASAAPAASRPATPEPATSAPAVSGPATSGPARSAPPGPALRRARELAAEAVAARTGTRVAFGTTTPGAPAGALVVVAPSADSELLAADLFAPVVSLVPVASVDEAVALANRCPFALGASVFGPERDARAVAGRLRAGVVTVNDLVVPTADPRLPFGGRGASGYGVTRGEEGLVALTVPKVVAVRRSGPPLHFEAPRPADEALFAAWLRLAHGSPGRRLLALPALLAALVRRSGPASRTEVSRTPQASRFSQEEP